jgi:hypothetical protein
MQEVRRAARIVSGVARSHEWIPSEVTMLRRAELNYVADDGADGAEQSVSLRRRCEHGASFCNPIDSTVGVAERSILPSDPHVCCRASCADERRVRTASLLLQATSPLSKKKDKKMRSKGKDRQDDDDEGSAVVVPERQKRGCANNSPRPIPATAHRPSPAVPRARVTD